MNYYERHIGDYIKDTVSLTMLEDGAYNRLIDQCYQTEKPLPSDIKEVYREARAVTGPERKAVDYVLGKFFERTENGYVQKRIGLEIIKYQDKQSKAKRSADARWEAVRTQSVGNANASETHIRTQSVGNALQSPVTSHQLIPSVAKATAASPQKLTDPDEIIFGYGLPMLTTAGTAEKQARSFLGGLRKHHGDEALIDKLRECAKAKPLQPLEWLAGALPPKGAPPKPNLQEALEASNRAIAQRFLAKDLDHVAQ
ncbi:MAG: YdaU family protein [Rhizobiaceae bacterium]